MAERDDTEMIIVVAAVGLAAYLLLRKTAVTTVTPTNSLTTATAKLPTAAVAANPLSPFTGLANDIKGWLSPSSTTRLTNSDLTTGNDITTLSQPGITNPANPFGNVTDPFTAALQTGQPSGIIATNSDPFANVVSPIASTPAYNPLLNDDNFDFSDEGDFDDFT